MLTRKELDELENGSPENPRLIRAIVSMFVAALVNILVGFIMPMPMSAIHWALGVIMLVVTTRQSVAYRRAGGIRRYYIKKSLDEMGVEWTDEPEGVMRYRCKNCGWEGDSEELVKQTCVTYADEWYECPECEADGFHLERVSLVPQVSQLKPDRVTEKEPC